ncbi:MAG: histidine phosphatase family protein [Rhodococcus sp.]|uniref:histidine phosphatase family protein n=1 Tax=Rhodococcus TaxID=1827 RepID=UPI00169019CC|nr:MULTISPECIES: histidine phosphatase family protein [Rhodococcus]NLV79355.1 histidine phosphatase family protein [Rhodococcus sp. (in: high G+C Gram-positive bacteria)]
MSGRLILARHGQTFANVERRLDTALPGAELTDLGVAQAKTLGTKLVERAPSLIVSSYAIRARQTAQHAEDPIGLHADAREGLHEVQVGELENRSDEESHKLFMKVYESWHAGDLRSRVPGGESAVDVLDRFVPVLDALRGDYLEQGSGDIVVVSHGAAIRLVAARLGKVPGGFAIGNHLANTDTVELVPVAGGGWECVRWAKFEAPFHDTARAGSDDPMG